MGKATRVVVTGFEVNTVFGDNKDVFWKGLLTAESCIKTENRNILDENTIDKVAVLIEKLSSCLLRSLEESGISKSELEKRNAVFIYGTFLGEVGCMKKNSFDKARSFDAIPIDIQKKLNIDTPFIVLTNACASGIQAIGLGRDLIYQRKFDLVIVCGYEVIDQFVLAGMTSIRAIGNQLRPFDAERNGTVISDGIGVIILEQEEQAIIRDAEIYAEILGYGLSNDAYNYVRPHPEATGMVNSIKMALEDSKNSIDDIDFICAHGTGTKLNDTLETKAIKTVFGERAYQIPITSIKGAIGHTLGASGILGCIATILSINEKCIIPTINYANQDLDCDLDYVPNKSRQKTIKRALCNASGFGGVNAVLGVGCYSSQTKVPKHENIDQKQIYIGNGKSKFQTKIQNEYELIKNVFSVLNEVLNKQGEEQIRHNKIGLVIDVNSGVNFPSQKKFLKQLSEKDIRLLDPTLFCFSFPNRITGEIAREYGITGPTITICDSAPNLEKAFLIGEALLNNNKAQKVLVGKIGIEYIIILMLEYTEKCKNNKDNFDMQVESLIIRY